MEARHIRDSAPREAAGGHSSGADDSEATSLQSFFSSGIRVLRRRKKLAALVFLIFVVPAVIVIRRTPWRYEATARILVERNETVSSVLKESRSGDQPTNDFQTQLQILRSRPVVTKAITKIKFWEAPEFAGQSFAKDLTGPEISAAGLVDAFLGRLTIIASPGTHILNVTFESEDPAVAMKAVNTLVQTYIDEQAKAESASSAESLDWLQARLAEAAARLRASEAAPQAYIENNQDAVSLQDRQNIVVQKLADLNAAVTRAKTERIAKQTLYDQLRSTEDDRTAADSLPVVLSNGGLQQLRAQLAELRQKELTAAQDLGDRHPDLLKIRSEIGSTEARLRAELAKVMEAVKNDYLAAETQEQSLVRALDAQKRDVLDLNRKSVEYGALERQAASDREIYQRLLNETQTRGITGKTAETHIQIVEPAELPRSPVGPKRNQELALTLFGGLLLALSAPQIRESLDHRVKTPADLEQRLNLRCLAMIPIVPSDLPGKSLLLTSDANAFNEAFRRVRTAVRLGSSAPGTTRLLVTSAGPREGKSLVAANLAMALAQVNQRVLLIDSDLRRPKIHRMLALSPFPGFADVLNGDATVEDAIRRTSTPNLFVLPCGLKHRSSSELLSSSSVQRLLEQFDDRFDWIVFDTPPTGPVADACVIGQWVHQAILVVSADSTPMAAAQATIEQLEAARISIAGAILNRVDLEHSGYYYAPYYNGGYSDYYTTPVTAHDRRKTGTSADRHTGKPGDRAVETASASGRSPGG